MTEVPLGEHRPSARAAISVVAVGTVLTQLLLFGTSAILARFFSPAEFGQFSVAVALASIIATIATLQYETAGPLAETDGEATDICVLAILLAGVATVVTSVALFVLAEMRPSSVDSLGSSIWIVPPTVFAISSWAALRMLHSRLSNFAAISSSGVWSTFVQGVAQILAGVAHLGALSLALGYLLGRTLNAGLMARKLPPVAWQGLRRYVSLASTWRRMPLLFTIPVCLNVFGIGAIVPLIAAWFGVASAGQFAFALRIVGLPSALLGQAFALVLFPRFADQARRGGGEDRTVSQAATVLAMTGVPVFGLLFLTGPEVFAWVFGSTWRLGGEMAAILAPWFMLSFISSPLSGLMLVRNRLVSLVVLSFVELALRIGALAVGFLAEDIILGTIGYAIAGSVICLGYIGWALHLSGTSFWAWIRPEKWYALTVLVGYPCVMALGPLDSALGVASVVVLTGGMTTWAVIRLGDQLFGGIGVALKRKTQHADV